LLNYDQKLPTASLFCRTLYVTIHICLDYDTIRYDTIVEINVDSKAEYTA